MSKFLQGEEKKIVFKARPSDVLGVVARHKLALIASNSALRTPTSRRVDLLRQMGKTKKKECVNRESNPGLNLGKDKS